MSISLAILLIRVGGDWRALVKGRGGGRVGGGGGGGSCGSDGGLELEQKKGGKKAGNGAVGKGGGIVKEKGGRLWESKGVPGKNRSGKGGGARES